MSSSTDGIEIVGADEYPATASVKLHGPPGTGKTTQTIERLRRLLEDHRFGIADLAFITYRRSMAEEFLRRLYDEDLIEWSAVAKPYAGPARYVGTLHAVCNRLADLPSPAEKGTTPDRHKSEFCRDRFGVRYFKPNEEANPTPGELMFSARSWCIENRVDFENWHHAPQYGEISEAWRNRPPLVEFHHEWEDYKGQRGISDFEDMLLEVAENELAPPGDVLAIDEFHDFTPLQAEIATNWMDQAEIVIANGDPLQVVYSYKGADPEFYLDLDLPEVLLPRSYRVPEKIWRYAGEALQPEHEPPEITPREDPGEILERESAPLGASRGVRRKKGLAPGDVIDEYGGDVMFLARTNAQVRDIGAALREAGVIYRSQDSGGGWNDSEKRLAIYNALKGLEGIREPRGISGQQTIGHGDWEEESGTPAKEVKLSGSEWWRFLDRVPASYLSETKKNLEELVGGAKADETISAREIGKYTSPKFWRVFTKGADSVTELLKYEQIPAIRKALERYDSRKDHSDIETKALTIHASKGGEAETVVVYDGIPQKVSEAKAHDPAEAKNEARLWYVACTRASERLIVARRGWEWTHEYLPPAKPYEVGEVSGP